MMLKLLNSAKTEYHDTKILCILCSFWNQESRFIFHSIKSLLITDHDNNKGRRGAHMFYFVLISGVGSMPILAKHVFFVLRLRVKHAEKAHPVHMKRSSLSSLQYLCCPSCFDTPCACQSKIRLYLPLK